VSVASLGTPVIARTTSGSSVTGTYPNGSPTAGNVLWAVVLAAGVTSAASLSTPAGWTQAGSIGDSGPTMIMAVYWKVAAGGDAAPTFTATLAGTEVMTCTLYETSGADTTTPVDTFGTATAIATAALTTTTSGNVTGSGEYAISGQAMQRSAAGTLTSYTPGTGWTNATSDISTSSRFHSCSDFQSNPASGAALSEAITWTITPQYTVGFVLVIGAGPAGVTGTGSLALAPLAFSGSGLAGITGSGSLALAPLAFAGSGLIQITGSGGLALAPLAFSGSGLIGAVTGTGALALAPLALAGAGLVGAVSGSGGLALAPLAMSGAGLAGITGTGALALAPLALAGAGLAGLTGTGSLALAPLAFTGSGLIQITGSGGLALAPLAFAGSGGQSTPPLGIFIYSGLPALGNLIIAISPVAGVDASGNAYGAAVLNQSALTGLLAALKAGQLVLGSTGANAPGLTVQAADPQFAKTSGLATQAVSFNARLVPMHPGSSSIESWQAFNPLSNGWAVAGTGPGASYRLTVQNEIQFSATLNCGSATVTDGTAVCPALPAAYRPASAHTFPVTCDVLRVIATGPPTTTEGARFVLSAGGVLSCFGIAAAATQVSFEVKIPLDI